MKYTVKSFKEEFNISASKVVNLLEHLKEGGYDTYFGICYNLSNLIEDTNGDLRKMGYEIVEEFSVGWEHHTGNKEYPIPYRNSRNSLWTGKQLEYRLDLIDYIIKQLEEIK